MTNGCSQRSDWRCTMPLSALLVPETTLILEAAQIRIRAQQTTSFEAAYRQAQQHLSAAEGYLSHELRRCLEQPDQYLLLVHWRRLEDHTVGFRGSQHFQEWRRLIGAFFDGPPSVVHYQALDNQTGD